MKTRENKLPSEQTVFESSADVSAKKPYATPKLTVHGNVEKITGNTAPGSLADATFAGSHVT